MPRISYNSQDSRETIISLQALLKRKSFRREEPHYCCQAWDALEEVVRAYKNPPYHSKKLAKTMETDLKALALASTFILE